MRTTAPRFSSSCCQLRALVLLWALFLSGPLLLADDSVTVEQLGIAERKAAVAGYAFSPGTATYPPRLLVGFRGNDGTWIVDLRQGKARRAKASGFDTDHLSWPTLIAADGKLFSSCARGGLSVYDPATDIISLHRPIPAARWLRGMAIGPDGAVYVSDYPSGSAAKYEPKTAAVTLFGRQGGPFDITHVYGYSVGCDGRFVYTAAGKIPWYVVAYDTATGQQKNLLQFDPATHPEVHQRGGRVFLEVTRSAPPAGKPARELFELAGGQAKPTDELPRYDDSHVPGNSRPQPVISALGRNLPVSAEGAAITYRTPDSDEQKVTIPVAGRNMSIERLSPLADGRLALCTGPYGNVHVFDPKSNEITLLGNPASKSVYDLLQSSGKIYFCGYPNAILGTFDEGAGVITGNWHESLQSKHAVHLVQGADGRLYSGNHNERESTGGALGWYDPKTGEFGGLHFPNDDCEWLTTARAGSLVVYASDFSHDPAHPEIGKREGRLLIFDTRKQQITGDISPLADGSAGVVVEARPGVLFGLGLHNKVPVMYRIDLESEKVLHSPPLPAPATRTLALGPDGKVYFFVRGKLMRANAETFDIETLCEAEPGRMVFMGGDLYLAGTDRLRRIAGIAGR